MDFIFIIFFKILLFHCVASQVDNNGVNYRLPNTTHPETYDLSITTRIDSTNFGFTGDIKIKIVVDVQTTEIVLHMEDLEISQIILNEIVNGVAINIKDITHTYEPVTHFLKVKKANMHHMQISNTFNTGEVFNLRIRYNGTLSTEPVGFYRVEYVNSAGEKECVLHSSM